MNKKNVISFFLAHQTNYTKEQIWRIKKIHNGYTNLSYYFKMNDGTEYQVRMSKKYDLVDRVNEKNVLKLIEFNKEFIYLDNDGNAIKKWILGHNVKQKDITMFFLQQLVEEIDLLHKTKYSSNDILKHDYLDVLKSTKIQKKYLELYKKCLSILDEENWVLSHNDLNCDNILINEKNKIIFIDYEWARINHPLWDVVNFARETKLTKQQIDEIIKLSHTTRKKFYTMLYICLCFAMDWAHQNPNTIKLIKYKLVNTMYLKRIYKYLIDKVSIDPL